MVSRCNFIIFGLVTSLILGCSGHSQAQLHTEFELDNGLRVKLLPLPTAKKNTLVVLYNVGNENDPAGKSGMAHLAEHLYVTAATRNTAARNVQEYMSAYPDGWNAQTGDDYTVIATVFSADRWNDEIADAADRMRKIQVDQSDLDRELPRIDIELKNMYEGFPPLAVSNHGRHHSRLLANGGRRGGKVAELKTVTVDDMQGWLDQYYKPGNAILILAGAFDTEDARKKIEKNFGSIGRGQKPGDVTAPGPAEKRVHEVSLQPVSANAKSRVGYTFKAPRADDPLYAAFLVHVMRMQMAAQRTAKKKNMQDMPFMFRPLDDPDFFYASVDVKDGETSDEALNRLDKMMSDHLGEDFQAFHVKQTRAMLGLFLGTQDMPARMLAFNTYGAAFALGRREQLGIDPAKLQEQFDEVDARQMEEASKKFFGESNRITIVGQPK